MSFALHLLSSYSGSCMVMLRNAGDVERVVSNANRLRHSTDTTIKSSIFINRHPMSTQSRAADDLRCQRRQSVRSRSSHLTGQDRRPSATGPVHQTSHHLPPLVSTSHRHASSVLTPLQSPLITSSTLPYVSETASQPSRLLQSLTSWSLLVPPPMAMNSLMPASSSQLPNNRNRHMLPSCYRQQRRQRT